MNAAVTQLHRSISSSYLAQMFLWQKMLIDNLVTIETLLPWQPVNCAINWLYVSILSLHKAHVFLGTKYVNAYLVAMVTTVTMATKGTVQ